MGSESLFDALLSDAESLRAVPLYYKSDGGTFLLAARTPEIATTLDRAAKALETVKTTRDVAEWAADCDYPPSRLGYRAFVRRIDAALNETEYP